MQKSGGILWKRANDMFDKPRQQWKNIDEMVYGVNKKANFFILKK